MGLGDLLRGGMQQGTGMGSMVDMRPMLLMMIAHAQQQTKEQQEKEKAEEQKKKPAYTTGIRG